MNLLVVGVDHRSAPTSIREMLAFDEAARARALDELKSANPLNDHVILSTCNRVEIYAGAHDEQAPPDAEAMTAWLARFHHVGVDEILKCRVLHRDGDVVRHLFRVTSSLESLVLGEGQILGQVKEAYRAASGRESIGSLFHALFQRAIHVGKQVRALTGLDQGRLSISSVAVELAQSIFESFHDKVVLVIGAGKMGELTLRHFAELAPGRVLICNRNIERAHQLAAGGKGEVVPFDRLDDALAEADVVISTTAAEQPIVSYDRYRQLQRKARGGRLALILDLAVPRDFDARIGDLDQVLLYNVDDLRSQVEQNLRQRQAQIQPAHALIEAEAAACLAELTHQRDAGALLRQLGDYGDELASRELARFFGACPDLSEPQRRAAEHMVHRLKNQFLHHPRTALRSGPQSFPETRPGAHPLLAAVRHLFGLGQGGGLAPPHDRDPNADNA